MTLATHAIAGAAVATLFPQHPLIGLAAGFASHFALDAIPHWDYKLESTEHKEDLARIDMPIGPKFWRDLARTGIDSLAGLLISIALFHGNACMTMLAILGAGSGVLPDLLQFAYFKWKHEPLRSLQRFHHAIQRDRRFQHRPAIGIPLQVAILACVVAAHFWLSGRPLPF